MKLIPRHEVKVGERVRIPQENDVTSLARDIHEKGLLQPIVITQAEDPWLVAGEHRMLALETIAGWGLEGGYDATYRHNEQNLPCDVIPFVTVGELSDAEMIEYEIAENVVRTDIPWPDRVKALSRLAAIKGSNIAAARHLVDKGDTKSQNALEIDISKAILVADHLTNPRVAAAKTISEAFSVVKKDAAIRHARLLERTIDAEIPSTSPHTFYPYDMIDGFAKIQNDTVDLILSDPPYGVDADSWTTKFRDTPHEYKDSLSKALSDAAFIMSEGLKVTRERANLFMFCAPQHWSKLAELAIIAGWSIWPRPVIWKKSNEGIRPWGQSGLCYTYESILYATKNGKGLRLSFNDVIEVYKVDRSERVHGAQKPVELYQRLIEAACMPGDVVLDPTCGSGTIFPACTATRTIGIGFERDESFHHICRNRMNEFIPPVEREDHNLEDL